MNIKTVEFNSAFGKKSIEVYCDDITRLPMPVDVLSVSAFIGNYDPVCGTVIGALYSNSQIDVDALSRDPRIDLRALCNVWLSKSLGDDHSNVGRIGCIELLPLNSFSEISEQTIIDRLSAYFHMLSLAGISGIPVETVTLPLLGGGNQHIDSALVITPMVRLCLEYLAGSPYTNRIVLCQKSHEKAEMIADQLGRSYALMDKKEQEKKNSDGNKRCVFISHSSGDKNIADNLCAKLESRGVRVWYAPRDVGKYVSTGDYASAIFSAIKMCTDFVVIISRNSLSSQHVLNEIDLAFNRLPDIAVRPLRMDEEEMGDAFQYYLSRQHWMDATLPPLEARLNEFADAILTNRSGADGFSALSARRRD